MAKDPLPPPDVTFAELRAHAEGSWRLQGPNSGGGTTLYRYQGQLFVVGYGDYSPDPGGAEQVIATLPDNSPGFPPVMEGGHVAGCAHEAHWNWDWWLHRTFLLRVEPKVVLFYEAGKEVWSCPTAEFVQPGCPQGDLVRRVFGPAGLDEALRCARVRLGR